MIMINKNLISPTINDRLLKEFGADLLSYEVGACSYSNGYVLPSGKIIPVHLKPSIGLRKIILIMDFSAPSPVETARSISEVTDILHSSPEIMLPDGFYYWCEFDRALSPRRVAPWIEQVEFRLFGVRHGPIQNLVVSNGSVVNVEGNIETPITVLIQPSGDSMTFQGITITGSSPVIINGLKTTVKDLLGNNVFGSTDMTRWPTLQPGENTISMSGATSAAISYYPLWK